MGALSGRSAANSQLPGEDMRPTWHHEAKERQHDLPRHRYQSLRDLPVGDAGLRKSIFTRTLCLYSQALLLIAPRIGGCRADRIPRWGGSLTRYSYLTSNTLDARGDRDDISGFSLTRARACLHQTLIERKIGASASRYTNIKNIVPIGPIVQTYWICSIISWADRCWWLSVRYPSAPTNCRVVLISTRNPLKLLGFR